MCSKKAAWLRGKGVLSSAEESFRHSASRPVNSAVFDPERLEAGQECTDGSQTGCGGSMVARATAMTGKMQRDGGGGSGARCGVQKGRQ